MDRHLGLRVSITVVALALAVMAAFEDAIGIKVTSALVKDAILQVVDAAIADGTLTEQGDLVVPA